MYWAIAMICVALDYQSDLKDREIRTAGLERLLSEARLATLRSQLDPHFLFNTLNSISAYVESAPRQARLMIEQLGDLLRLVARARRSAGDPARVRTDLHRSLHPAAAGALRRPARRQVRVDPDVMTRRCPTFLLQPLVENAIHHGTSKLSARGILELSRLAQRREPARARARQRPRAAAWAGPSSATSASDFAIRARVSNSSSGRRIIRSKSRRDDQRGTCVDVIFPFRVA